MPRRATHYSRGTAGFTFIYGEMTVLPAFADSIQVEMAQQANAAYAERYLDGTTDAALGHLLAWADFGKGRVKTPSQSPLDEPAFDYDDF
jgi:hypothetical protein